MFGDKKRKEVKMTRLIEVLTDFMANYPAFNPPRIP